MIAFQGDMYITDNRTSKEKGVRINFILTLHSIKCKMLKYIPIMDKLFSFSKFTIQNKGIFLESQKKFCSNMMFLSSGAILQVWFWLHQHILWCQMPTPHVASQSGYVLSWCQTNHLEWQFCFVICINCILVFTLQETDGHTKCLYCYKDR